jgi:hypothetical protein
MSSADSVPREKIRGMPGVPAITEPAKAESPAKSKRRSVVIEKQPSPRKQPVELQRSDSRAKKPPRQQKICVDPDCSECGSGKPRAPKPSSLDTGIHIDYEPFNSQKNSSLQYPTSPTAKRRSAIYNNTAVVTPAVPRRRSSSTSRPQSYHEAMYAGRQYNVAVPPPPIEQKGPPPASSAYAAAAWQMQYNNMYGQTPPAAPVLYQQTSPTFDPRPQIQRVATDTTTYNTRRSSGAFAVAPVISYGPQAGYGNDPSAASRISARYANPTSAFESSSEESDDDEGYDEQEDRRLVSLRSAPARRPSQRRTQTEGAALDSRFRPAALRIDYDNRGRSRGDSQHRERPQMTTNSNAVATSRNTSSTRRPSLASSARTKATSYSNPSGTRMIVESARDARRQSYVGYENFRDLERKHDEAAKGYRQDIEPYDGESAYASYARGREYRVKRSPERRERPRQDREYELTRPERRRTKTDADVRINTEGNARRKTDAAQSSAEAYLHSNGNTVSDPVAEVLRANFSRSQNLIAADSRSTTSRSSAGKRTTVTRDTQAGGAMSLRIDPQQGVTSIDLGGNMDGQTISIRQTENGTSEIVLGTVGARDREKQYRVGSKVGSRVGSKVRRDRDDSIVSETRSRRSDRDRERDGGRVDPRRKNKTGVLVTEDEVVFGA